jgi:nicotinate-nucleotide pyrophosphorylase (carboxylating)
MADMNSRPLPHITATHCVQELIKLALKEDIGPGDVTSEALVEEGRPARAALIAKGAYVLAGAAVAESVFQNVDPTLTIVHQVTDGSAVAAGDTILEVAGSARSILAGERTALNFIQRMTGIATLTARFVELARPYGADILDTRKTAPGMRILDKYAVRCGGGKNHRIGLYDRILIKDNHAALWNAAAPNRLADAVRQARARYPGLLIEVEVQSPDELHSILEAEPDWVLLDNMTLDQMRECARRCQGRCKTEASGGIHLQSLESVLQTGVQAVSVGALTHSAPAADFSLELTA